MYLAYTVATRPANTDFYDQDFEASVTSPVDVWADLTTAYHEQEDGSFLVEIKGPTDGITKTTQEAINSAVRAALDDNDFEYEVVEETYSRTWEEDDGDDNGEADAEAGDDDEADDGEADNGGSGGGTSY